VHCDLGRGKSNTYRHFAPRRLRPGTNTMSHTSSHKTSMFSILGCTETSRFTNGTEPTEWLYCTGTTYSEGLSEESSDMRLPRYDVKMWYLELGKNYVGNLFTKHITLYPPFNLPPM
jgi:hypothetical protein